MSSNRRKICLSFMIFTFLLSQNHAQIQNEKNPAKNKAVQTTENLNKASNKIQQSTEAMQSQVQEAGEHIHSSVQNVKAIVSVFEPIWKIHLKSKKQLLTPDETSSDAIKVPVPSESNSTSNSTASSTPSNSAEQNDLPPSQEVLIPETSSYNSDGTANLGNQNNNEFGCYLDLTSGTILDEVDAAGNTRAVDLIFTATDYFGSTPMYAFLSPSLVKNDVFANYYFRGSQFKDANIPVRQWEEVNESEIALTNLTLERFEKIKNNKQLEAVIKQTSGYKDKYESRTKLQGKVFAVKTHMAQRETSGLIYVVDQLASTGVNGFLKIKIKVTGFDSNGDGNPDTNNYINH